MFWDGNFLSYNTIKEEINLAFFQDGKADFIQGSTTVGFCSREAVSTSRKLWKQKSQLFYKQNKFIQV